MNSNFKDWELIEKLSPNVHDETERFKLVPNILNGTCQTL
jgi:hypothetical protein